MKKRTVALLCAAVMLLGVVFGGTMAWLSRGTKGVVNTFTTASVGLDLTETTGPEYIMAPGTVLDKDPKVIVTKDSASCYLFVKVDSNNWPEGASWYEFDIAPGWKPVPGEAGVYYRIFDEANPGTEVETITDKDGNVLAEGYAYSILKDDQVSFTTDLTKDVLEDYKDNPNERSAKLDWPQLNFTAYAIQRDYLKDAEGNELTEADVAAIWALAQREAQAPTQQNA